MSSSEKNNMKLVRERMREIWPTIAHEINEDSEFAGTPEAAKWLIRLMNRNCTKGKLNRGLATITFYDHVVSADGETEREDEHLVYVLGWINEIGQAAALIADDIMDGAETRRGEKCWHRKKKVGMSAVNDALLLENTVFFILYKYYSGKKYFPRLLSLFHDILFKTILGQNIDTRFALEFKWEECTLEKYKRIVDYKTSFYTFYQPYAAALVMAGITNKLVYDELKEISLEMGYLFQVQDDFLDLYGDPDRTGKIGTDIIDRKCTWLLVTALENATEEQIKTLKICYGSQMKEDEIKVKLIYKDLKMKERFQAFEKKSSWEIGNKIKLLPPNIPKGPLLTLLNALYRRKK